MATGLADAHVGQSAQGPDGTENDRGAAIVQGPLQHQVDDLGIGGGQQFVDPRGALGQRQGQASLLVGLVQHGADQQDLGLLTGRVQLQGLVGPLDRIILLGLGRRHGGQRHRLTVPAPQGYHPGVGKRHLVLVVALGLLEQGRAGRRQPGLLLIEEQRQGPGRLAAHVLGVGSGRGQKPQSRHRLDRLALDQHVHHVVEQLAIVAVQDGQQRRDQVAGKASQGIQDGQAILVLGSLQFGRQVGDDQGPGGVQLLQRVLALLRAGLEVLDILVDPHRVAEVLFHRGRRQLDQFLDVLLGLLVDLDGVVVFRLLLLHPLPDRVDLVLGLEGLGQPVDVRQVACLVERRHVDPRFDEAQLQERDHAVLFMDLDQFLVGGLEGQQAAEQGGGQVKLANVDLELHGGPELGDGLGLLEETPVLLARLSRIVEPRDFGSFPVLVLRRTCGYRDQHHKGAEGKTEELHGCSSRRVGRAQRGPPPTLVGLAALGPPYLRLPFPHEQGPRKSRGGGSGDGCRHRPGPRPPGAGRCSWNSWPCRRRRR